MSKNAGLERLVVSSLLTRPSWFSNYRNAVHVEKHGRLVGIYFSFSFTLVGTIFYFALIKNFWVHIFEESKLLASFLGGYG